MRAAFYRSSKVLPPGLWQDATNADGAGLEPKVVDPKQARTGKRLRVPRIHHVRLPGNAERIQRVAERIHANRVGLQCGGEHGVKAGFVLQKVSVIPQDTDR